MPLPSLRTALREHVEHLICAGVRRYRGVILRPEFIDAVTGAPEREPFLSAIAQRIMRERDPLAFVSADSQDTLLDALVTADLPRVLAAIGRADPAFPDRAQSFSQEGEDLILARLLAGRPPGFFVDVGAYHPFRYSNTYLLYLAGWRGLNLDATPGTMDLFRRFRPEDTNIECFVGDPASDHAFVMYNEPALNTGSAAVAAGRVLPEALYRRIGEARMRPRRLGDLLDEHAPAGRPIVFMNVDVEGLEMEVLRSNDWTRHRPEILLIEQLATDLTACLEHETTRFLEPLGYRPIAKAYNTAFFRLAESPS